MINEYAIVDEKDNQIDQIYDIWIVAGKTSQAVVPLRPGFEES